MSWFDTSTFSKYAKTALKQAQKNIDKVLDIKDEVDSLENKTGIYLFIYMFVCICNSISYLLPWINNEVVIFSNAL